MAPKKVATVFDSADAPAAPQPPAPRAKKAAKKADKDVPKADATSEVVDAKKPRNMSACSTDFVSTVYNSLSSELSQKLKPKDVKEVCEAFVKTLVSNVIDGKNVNFTNHMSFARRVRAARVYKNLKTKESITNPKHYVMTMTVKPNLKKQFDEVNVDEQQPATAA